VIELAKRLPTTSHANWFVATGELQDKLTITGPAISGSEIEQRKVSHVIAQCFSCCFASLDASFRWKKLAHADHAIFAQEAKKLSLG
jgi:hypothetical protein